MKRDPNVLLEAWRVLAGLAKSLLDAQDTVDDLIPDKPDKAHPSRKLNETNYPDW